MPGFLLHRSAQVLCLHAGQAQPITTNQRVKVGGQPVVTQQDQYTISGCANPPPPVATGPCVTGTWTKAATKVRAGGQPVLLMDAQATCSPTATGLMPVNSQNRVKGV